MAQYHRWKKDHPHDLLFFRMGDFFELFFDDAKVASRALGLALTSRSKGENAIPMAGVPVRSVDQYLKKLVALGHRVAICDQVQDPKDADGVIDRAVTRIVTAGTLTEDDLLDRARSNFLAALVLGAPPKDSSNGARRAGLAFVELSTGEFLVEETDVADALDAVARLSAAELLVAEDDRDADLAALAERAKSAGIAAVTRRPDWQFEATSAREALFTSFRVRTLEGFGLDDASPAVAAAGAALRYLEETQRTQLAHLRPPRLAVDSERLLIDRATRSCLELTETARDGRREGSLLWILDQSTTALGARRVRDWLLAPLRDVATIRARQSAVETLVLDGARRGRVREALRSVADVERLLTRIVTNRASGRDLVALRTSLDAVPHARAALDGAPSDVLASLAAALDARDALRDRLARGLVDDPPLTIKDGGLIRAGFSAELDELKSIGSDGHRFLAQFQTDEIARTGIANLKVGFNRVFGFYIEITNSGKDRVPTHYIRKQTLKNAERFITPELKDHESKVLGAEERSKALEYELFQELRAAVVGELAALQRTAAAIADLDALCAFAEVAALHGWVRPAVDDGDAFDVIDGRHPVLAATLGASRFVPNGCRLDGGARRLAIVTGPNMAGKSTFIRQVATIQILAQTGSFVPAKSATIGVSDRVFARVGASDDLTRGNSTFMVEMTETANILNNATAKSLVILDEVGRGTSTFDGMALAWAISEHLVDVVRARTLFATHYHQLIELKESHSGVFNLNVAVREWGDEIVFLHQIVEGGSDRSYGIHVARLAGVPEAVLARAAQILKDLEASAPDLRPVRRDGDKRGTERVQQALFESAEKKLARDLKEIDIDRLSPMDALLKLKEWKERA